MQTINLYKQAEIPVTRHSTRAYIYIHKVYQFRKGIYPRGLQHSPTHSISSPSLSWPVHHAARARAKCRPCTYTCVLWVAHPALSWAAARRRREILDARDISAARGPQGNKGEASCVARTRLSRSSSWCLPLSRVLVSASRTATLDATRLERERERERCFSFCPPLHSWWIVYI